MLPVPGQLTPPAPLWLTIFLKVDEFKSESNIDDVPVLYVPTFTLLVKTESLMVKVSVRASPLNVDMSELGTLVFPS